MKKKKFYKSIRFNTTGIIITLFLVTYFSSPFSFLKRTLNIFNIVSNRFHLLFICEILFRMTLKKPQQYFEYPKCECLRSVFNEQQ